MGKPAAFYVNEHEIFASTARRRPETGDEITQFDRSLRELTIDIICADSRQAKGRVERAFSTLQDRFVKELPLDAISTMDTANA